MQQTKPSHAPRSIPRPDRDRTPAQAEAEAALIAGREATDEIAEAGRHIVEDTAEITRRGAEAISQTVESGLKMAALVTEQSIDSLAQGMPGAPDPRSVERSSRGMQAMFDSGTLFADACQKAGQEWLAGLQERQQQRVEALSRMLRCTSAADLAEVQVDLARHQFESAIRGGQRASTLLGDAAVEALRRIDIAEPAD